MGMGGAQMNSGYNNAQYYPQMQGQFGGPPPVSGMGRGYAGYGASLRAIQGHQTWSLQGMVMEDMTRLPCMVHKLLLPLLGMETIVQYLHQQQHPWLQHQVDIQITVRCQQQHPKLECQQLLLVASLA